MDDKFAENGKSSKEKEERPKRKTHQPEIRKSKSKSKPRLEIPKVKVDAINALLSVQKKDVSDKKKSRTEVISPASPSIRSTSSVGTINPATSSIQNISRATITGGKKSKYRISNALGITGAEKMSKKRSRKEPGPIADLNFGLLDKETLQKLEETEEEKEIDKELATVLAHYTGDIYNQKERERKARGSRYPNFTYGQMVSILNEHGIPVPPDEDYIRLEATHNHRWDPDGTVVEYYSPVLRSFIPVNMRGRYRGCWAEDNCVKGLDIGQMKPKPDALEGFMDKENQKNADIKYEDMSEVAEDEAHLGYLIEMQKLQAATLPIPIMYDVLNFGVEVLKENLEVIIEDGLPPSNRIYKTTETQTLKAMKKLEMYTTLGLKPLHTAAEKGELGPFYELTKDEVISDILKNNNEKDEFEVMLQEVARLHSEHKNKSKAPTPSPSTAVNKEVKKEALPQTQDNPESEAKMKPEIPLIKINAVSAISKLTHRKSKTRASSTRKSTGKKSRVLNTKPEIPKGKLSTIVAVKEDLGDNAKEETAAVEDEVDKRKSHAKSRESKKSGYL